MIEISLTEFIDFVTTAGSPKVTIVREVKKRHDEKYHPMKDFYKKLRDGIKEYHKFNKPRKSLDALVHGITDKNKIRSYPLIIQGYKKFLGRKSISWFDPGTKKLWKHYNLAVRVNPELGLKIDDTPHLIKMYWKEKPLKKLALPAILHLLHLKLEDKKHASEIGLLDVRRGKLFVVEEFDKSLTLLLEGEALSFANIYKSL